MRGTITRIVGKNGFGFITGSDLNNYFFHHSDLRGVSFEDLVLHQPVTFRAEDGVKGPAARDVQLRDPESPV